MLSEISNKRNHKKKKIIQLFQEILCFKFVVIQSHSRISSKSIWLKNFDTRIWIRNKVFYLIFYIYTNVLQNNEKLPLYLLLS